MSAIAGIGNLLSGGLFAGVNGLIDRIKGKSPEDAAKLAELVRKYDSEVLAANVAAMQAQADVNKVEAASPNLFIAGPRPFLLWVCGSAFASNYVVVPIARFICAAMGHPVEFPVLDLTEMMPVLLGLLGLGGMRTYEKTQGVQDKH